MRTFLDLRRHADAQLLDANYGHALHAYDRLLQLEPANLDVRMRVADCLLAMEEVQMSAEVYTALARYAASAGYPLRALVALVILTTLEPLLESLLANLAELYGRGSTRLGRGVRVAPDDPERLLPVGPTGSFELGVPAVDSVSAAAARGRDLSWASGVIPETLPPIPLFSELPAESFAAVLGALKLRRTRPRETILVEGDVGQSFFVLARGSVSVTKDIEGHPRVLANLHEGAIFGEMALVSAQPRTASVTSYFDCDLLEFDREALVAAAGDVETIATALDKFTRERLLNNLLATAPLFRPLDRKQRFDLVRRFTAHDVASGVAIIQEGAPGQGLYVLLSGQVDVSKRDGGELVLLATLSPGDVFGELALINDEAASATVTAATQSTVLFLAKEIFDKLVQAVPEIREYIHDLGEERMMDTRLMLEPSDHETLELGEDDLILI